MKTNRRDFLKGMAAVPFLGYFAVGAKGNITTELERIQNDYLSTLKIDHLSAPEDKLRPPTGNNSNVVRFGVIGNGWRGDQLLNSLGFVSSKYVEDNTINGKYTKRLQDLLDEED